jgi:hypothetical protein
MINKFLFIALLVLLLADYAGIFSKLTHVLLKGSAAAIGAVLVWRQIRAKSAKGAESATLASPLPPPADFDD